MTLYYQTISKEYVEFLRDENRTNSSGQTFYNLWAANGKSAPVAMATATYPPTDTQPPTAPSNLTAAAVSTSQINLQWTASTDNVAVAGYQVYRNGGQIATTATTSYQDSGLQAATSYSYFVKAYDAQANTSASSNTASAKTRRK